MPMWLTLCFENWCIEFLKRSKTNHSLNGRIRAGTPARRNLSLYCQYHQDQGHTTEECRNLDHLEQLVQEGKLKELLHHFSGWTEQIDLDPRRDASSRPPLRTINVIFAAPRRTGSSPSRVMSVARLLAKNSNVRLKRAKMNIQPILGFSNEDQVRTIQPYHSQNRWI